MTFLSRAGGKVENMDERTEQLYYHFKNQLAEMPPHIQDMYNKASCSGKAAIVNNSP